MVTSNGTSQIMKTDELGGMANVDTLAGVYTVSFLAVMGLFAIGNLLLKYKRSELPRPIRTL
jgi:hypothetical protein